MKKVGSGVGRIVYLLYKNLTIGVVGGRIFVGMYTKYHSYTLEPNE
jgi:hypothetical protein